MSLEEAASALGLGSIPAVTRANVIPHTPGRETQLTWGGPATRGIRPSRLSGGVHPTPDPALPPYTPFEDRQPERPMWPEPLTYKCDWMNERPMRPAPLTSKHDQQSQRPMRPEQLISEFDPVCAIELTWNPTTAQTQPKPADFSVPFLPGDDLQPRTSMSHTMPAPVPINARVSPVLMQSESPSNLASWPLDTGMTAARHQPASVYATSTSTLYQVPPSAHINHGGGHAQPPILDPSQSVLYRGENTPATSPSIPLPSALHHQGIPASIHVAPPILTPHPAILEWRGRE
ncbi:uncharacterized protein LOC134273093 [Saccostrea cucullata]|uniref:uncharacterized protein LOC134273093 n=1 Tax=Saccostrea cuccullata TaxID=36930 RepID=UPI002ED3EEAB